jgi:putative N-acetylmannosamine-6-phosphate epimerase
MDVLERVRGGLIVSVQANEESVINTPEMIAALARCAIASGAVGVRIEGAARIAAVHAALDAPIIGIIKRVHAGFEPYITSTIEEIGEAALAGAHVVAFDATERPRYGGYGVRALVNEIHRRARLAMADCSDEDDARAAAQAGADIIATTLTGYTGATRGHALPALDLVHRFSRFHEFVVCEGGVADPPSVAAAFAAGASAVVAGTALTNVDELVSRFVAATPRAIAR